MQGEQDEQVFQQTFHKLSLCLPLRDQDDPDILTEKLNVYYEVMSYIPLAHVVAAAERLVTHGSGYFPSTQEWSSLADDMAFQALAQEEARASLPPAAPSAEDVTGDDPWSRAKRARAAFLRDVRNFPPHDSIDWHQLADSFEKGIPCKPPYGEPFCPVCFDIGLAKHQCEEGGRCPAHVFDQEFEPHDYYQRCGCYSMNPTIQRRHEMAAHRR